MRKGLILFAAAMVVVFILAGLSTQDAQALSFPTPQWLCEDALNTPGYNFLPGSRYNPKEEQCLLGWQHVASGDTNICYPQLDVFQVVWGLPPYITDGVQADYAVGFYYYEWVGCQGNDQLIVDPNAGSEKLGDGVSFSYEAETCTNGCNIMKFGLTGAAKRALGSLPGEVKGKTYIQIRDDDGALVSGDFTLCFYAKGAKNPYFFRWAGGNTWAPMGGYWNGNNFCMAGTISGNYVMADMP